MGGGAREGIGWWQRVRVGLKVRKEKWRRATERCVCTAFEGEKGTTLSQIPREIPAAFFVLHRALSRMHIRRGRRSVNSFPRKISSASKRILRQILFVGPRLRRKHTYTRTHAHKRDDLSFSFYFADTRPPTWTPTNKTSNPKMTRA